MIGALNMLVGAAAVAGLFGLWILVQGLQRRYTPEYSEDADVLRCRMCDPNGNCGCGLRTFLRSRTEAGE